MPSTTERRSKWDYKYPNARSYQMLPPRPYSGNPNGHHLRHGYIFGYKTIVDPDAPTPNVSGLSPDAAERWISNAKRQIDYTNFKMFQFNPSNLPMTVAMMPADHPDAASPEGNLPNVAVGLAETTLELYFDRTEEIARAQNTSMGKEWRDLGVQLDLFDLLKVISGGDKYSQLAEYEEPDIVIDDPMFTGSVLPGSLNHLTGLLLDAAISGSAVQFLPFAVIFNQNLAIHVLRMKSLSFTYIRFTADLVPTTVQVVMSLEVANMGTKAYATGGGAGGPQTAPPGTTPTPTVPDYPSISPVYPV